MNEREALKLALEFIERVNRDGWILADFEPEMYATITAIKETLAQPEREWVGLTDEEKHDCYLRIDIWSRCYEMIEAKLREKNT